MSGQWKIPVNDQSRGGSPVRPWLELTQEVAKRPLVAGQAGVLAGERPTQSGGELGWGPWVWLQAPPLPHGWPWAHGVTSLGAGQRAEGRVQGNLPGPLLSTGSYTDQHQGRLKAFLRQHRTPLSAAPPPRGLVFQDEADIAQEDPAWATAKGSGNRGWRWPHWAQGLARQGARHIPK